MFQSWAPFVYRTRGLYFFLPLVASIIIKALSRGTTPLPLFVLGVAIAVVGQAFRMYSASWLWGRQVVTSPEAEFLCTSGPYAYVRNPLYLGNLIIGIGLCLTIGEWYAYLLFLASFGLVYAVVIPYEEEFLRKKFGAVYAAYVAATARLLPGRKPYKGPTSICPSLRAGILSEIHIALILGTLEVVVYKLLVV